MNDSQETVTMLRDHFIELVSFYVGAELNVMCNCSFNIAEDANVLKLWARHYLKANGIPEELIQKHISEWFRGYVWEE